MEDLNALSSETFVSCLDFIAFCSAKKASSFATMRSCSARGGREISNARKLHLLTSAKVVELLKEAIPGVLYLSR